MNPLDAIAGATAAIRDVIHPDNMTAATLMDPRDPAGGSYMLTLDIAQGVLFGVAFLVLLSAILFMILRGIYGLCGGREPNKLGYSSSQVWSVRAGYYGVGLVSLLSVVFIFLSTARFTAGMNQAQSLYANALPPLPEQQVEHLRQIQKQNQPVLDIVRDGFVANMTTQWESSVMNAFQPALIATNLSAEATALSAIMQRLDAIMDDMRPHRIFLFDLYNKKIPKIEIATASLPIRNDVLALMEKWKAYYNFNEMDNLFRNVNASMSALMPEEERVDALAFLAKRIEYAFSKDNYAGIARQGLESVNTRMQRVISTLSYGARRCDIAAATGQSIPDGSQGYVKFGTIMGMIGSLASYSAPIIYAVGALAALVIVYGAVAWSLPSYKAMPGVAGVLVLSIVTAWLMAGFYLPPAAITGDACNRPEWFQNEPPSLGSQFFAELNNVSHVPTCAVCDQSNMFVGWPEFTQHAKRETTDLFQLKDALNLPLASPTLGQGLAVGPAAVMTILENLNAKFASAAIQPPRPAAEWVNTAQYLKGTLPATQTQMREIMTQLEDASMQIQTHTMELYQGYSYFKGNLSLALAPIQSVNALIARHNKEMHETFDQILRHIQDQLNGVKGQYTTIPQDQSVQCTASPVQSANSTIAVSYTDFQDALCQQALVGMDGVWFFMVVSAVVWLPLTILAVKAYKILGFAHIVGSDFTF